MADWNLHDKPTVDPQDTDMLLVEQSDETAKATTVERLRNWLVNTALFSTLTTTVKNIVGAINEHDTEIGDIDVENDGNIATQIEGINTSLNHKANLLDVKIFTSLSDIGLSADDMTTDFSNNVLKIIKAMGKNRKFILYPYSGETNLNFFNSVKTWCGVNTDAYTVVIESSYNGGENLPNKIEIYPNTSDGENKYLYGFFDNALGTCKEVQYVSDSGWLTLPLASGITSVSGYTCQYRKIGKLVKLRGIVTNMSVLGTIGTLPSGFRPIVGAKFILTGNTDDELYGKFAVSTAGIVALGFTSKELTTSAGFYLDAIQFYID